MGFPKDIGAESRDDGPAMKYLIAAIWLFMPAPLWAGETQDPVPESSAPARSTPGLHDQCPKDMPPACACIEFGSGVKIMPAIEAYKSGAKILQVGPRKEN